jgi:hypothetical protein
MFIVQVAAVSCAATHVPESKTANQSFRYSGFRNAAKVEVLLGSSFIGVITGRSESYSKTRPVFTRIAKFGLTARRFRQCLREGASMQMRSCESIQFNTARCVTRLYSHTRLSRNLFLVAPHNCSETLRSRLLLLLVASLNYVL